jgi:hypothetical protein
MFKAGCGCDTFLITGHPPTWTGSARILLHILFFSPKSVTFLTGSRDQGKSYSRQQCCGSGSVGSICFWASRIQIRIRIHLKCCIRTWIHSSALLNGKYDIVQFVLNASVAIFVLNPSYLSYFPCQVEGSAVTDCGAQHPYHGQVLHQVKVPY